MNMDCYLGQIQLFGFYFIPQQWAACEGQIVPIASNEALYSLLGTHYGGDGRNTFALPNLKGAEPLPNMRYCISLAGIYPTRN